MNHRITRQFVGWERPLLHVVRDMLLRDARRFAAAVDLSGVTVVLHGARAGRRLLELLTLGAPGGALVPPRLLTLGTWTGLGTSPSGPTATDAARLAAWVGALRGLPPAARRDVAGLPDADAGEGATTVAWLEVARLIDGAHTELAGEALLFDDVARCSREADGFADADRWGALSQAQELYRGRVRAAGLCDPHIERVERLRAGDIDRSALVGGAAGRVVIAGISEMNAVARRLVQEVADACTILVPAPAELASRFDAFGCVAPEAWRGASLELPDDAVIVAEHPEGQAAAALRVIERLAGQPTPPDRITIGAPDAEVEERVRRLAGRLGGGTSVPVRRAGGTPVSFTRPVKLLLGVADYVERRDFGSMAALVRHPDVERWIVGVSEARGQAVEPERWLVVLDRYHTEHLHGHVDGRWFTEDAAEREVLETLHGALGELLTPLPGGASLLDDGARGVGEWCGLAWDVLRAVYSGWSSSSPARAVAKPRLDPATREACMVIQAHLSQLSSLPSSLAAGLLVTAGECLRLIVRQAAGDAIPEPGDAAAIDLVGWLELAADDAPYVIVTGMNEGSVPAAAGVDPLLPEGLRRTLGLPDRSSRFARDVLVASVVRHARPAGHAVFVFGRRSATGDPLAPSRLLMMGDERSLLRRVGQWTSVEAPAPEDTLLLTHGRSSGFDATVRVLPGRGVTTEIEEMSVTSFADYIASPYGFYLKHVLGLREVADAGAELDALAFGNLVHNVLLTLANNEVAASRDAERIFAFLSAQLEATAALTFGTDPRTEVWVQLEQARARLREFAIAQAAWAAEGWRIARTEWAPDRRTARLMVDGRPMYLNGRIDRIDVKDSGEWAVIDYKTGNRPPREVDAYTRDGCWRNPQLPLYRHLAESLVAELGVAGPPVLAWVALPLATAETAFVRAGWGDDELRAADEAAEMVVRGVRRGEFTSLGERPPSFGVIGLLCGGVEREEATP